MDMKLELVPMPVTDIDRAKRFYVDMVGFNEDLDIQPTEGVRIGLAWRIGPRSFKMAVIASNCFFPTANGALFTVAMR